MQTPEGNFKKLADLFNKEQLEGIKSLENQLSTLQQKAKSLQEETGKPHPVFIEGEELDIKGGKFRVHRIARNRLILKPIKY